MEPLLIVELVLAGITILAAALIGFRTQGGIGAFMLGVGALLASALCLAGTWLGLKLWENVGGWIGLAAGILLAGVLAYRASNKFVKGKSGWFAAALWLGYCTLCIFGYLAGGWLGLITITLFSIAAFWYVLRRVSAYILPLRDPNQLPQAFRSLITFIMGTNYPYYFIRDGKPEVRVEGDAFRQFFAGPGLVYIDPDHAAYLHSGLFVEDVLEPGLTFTGRFIRRPKALDLRTQVRAFYVDALTKDGIPIRVLVFIPFRVHTGGQKVELGKPFPFRRRAVFDIVPGELVGRERRKEEGGQRYEWDGLLVPMLTTPIVQEIISEYDVDELCAPLEPDRDPRDEIITEMKKRVSKVLQPRGLEIVGGGMGDLSPLDPEVIKRRLDNWKTERERQILILMSEGKAERVRQVEMARAAAEAEIVYRFSQIVQDSAMDDDVSQMAIALRFIDCIGEMVSGQGSQWQLPEGIHQTLENLRGELEEQQR